MSSRRVVMALASVCLLALFSTPMYGQSLGAAAAAAAKQRQAAGREQPPAASSEQKPASDIQKPAAPKPADVKETPPPRKVYTEDDLSGNRPEDRARAEKLKSIDKRYDALLVRLQDLEAKMKNDVKAAKGAEFEFKIFKLNMANANKYEERQALQKKLDDARAVVQQNLVALEKLRAEQRVLDAELQRVNER